MGSPRRYKKIRKFRIREIHKRGWLDSVFSRFGFRGFRMFDGHAEIGLRPSQTRSREAHLSCSTKVSAGEGVDIHMLSSAEISCIICHDWEEIKRTLRKLPPTPSHCCPCRDEKAGKDTRLNSLQAIVSTSFQIPCHERGLPRIMAHRIEMDRRSKPTYSRIEANTNKRFRSDSGEMSA